MYICTGGGGLGKFPKEWKGGIEPLYASFAGRSSALPVMFQPQIAHARTRTQMTKLQASHPTIR